MIDTWQKYQKFARADQSNRLGDFKIFRGFRLIFATSSVLRPNSKIGQVYAQTSCFSVTELPATSSAANDAPNKTAPVGPTTVNPKTSGRVFEVVRTPNEANQ